MIATDTFTNFGRRQASLKRQPHLVIAETPNPIRQLDQIDLRQRAEAMLDTVVWGLTAPAEIIQAHNQKIAAKTVRPKGIKRASHSV
jgi:hypothetical protein|tara:strand:+ start:571 stop:831 length:261 start_codon:yes stop_codon:yes gene_type:complete